MFVAAPTELPVVELIGTVVDEAAAIPVVLEYRAVDDAAAV